LDLAASRNSLSIILREKAPNTNSDVGTEEDVEEETYRSLLGWLIFSQY
jgi:hypothetical protein